MGTDPRRVCLLRLGARLARRIRIAGRKRELDARPDVVLTTYGCVRADAAKLKEVALYLVVIDEAQTIKNHATKAALACADVAASVERRVALSGTPVENRLEDLRNLFEFILPDYLGSLAHFKRMLKQPRGVESLQELTAPFLLRRRKTDPGICEDLPDKVEIRHDIVLHPAQQHLYKVVYEGYQSRMRAGRTRQERSRDLFSMMHALRKVCGEPSTLSRYQVPEGVDALPPLAGAKVEKLFELLTDIVAGGEHALVFCQYLATIETLRAACEAQGFRARTFTGALAEDARAEVVADFQAGAADVLFLTIGAGGVGITLTRATHVLHFDRCYNPAKESQATDRAHRIGQQRAVYVHLLLFTDTFEERLDDILRAKRRLALCTSEAWVQDYSDEELRQLFAFGGERDAKRPRTDSP